MRKRRFVVTCIFTFMALAVMLYTLGAASMHSASSNRPSSNQDNALKRIPRMIKDARDAGAQFERRDLFQAGARSIRDDAQLREILNDGIILDLNRPAIQRILQEGTEFIILPLPDGQGGMLELELRRVNLFADGFSVKTSKPNAENLEESLGVHYQGIVRGDDRSLAAISVFRNEVAGFFSTEAVGNSVVGRLGGNNPSDRHVIFADKEMKEHPEFSCDTEDKPQEQSAPVTLPQGPQEALARCVKIYIEANYDLFQNKGSVANVVSYVTALFNQSKILYANEGIPIQISEVFVWNTPSPYTGANSLSQLQTFQNTRTTFNGDLAHLVSLQSNFGGIAYVNVLCGSPRYAFSGIDPTFQNVPTYSWSVMVFTHETGHNMGSQHTHACAWNGNNTAIDGCATVEGTCSQPGIPSGGGTVMSYCHLQSVGINLSLGFGPQPAARMLGRFNAVTCLVDCGSGNCTFSGDPATRSFTAAGGSNSVNVIASSQTCTWTSAVNAPGRFENLSQSKQESLYQVRGEAGLSREPLDVQAVPSDVFLNSTPITINDRTSNSNPPGTASLYPSAINVSGMTGTITQVQASLNGLTHTWPDDVDVILVGPGGQRSILMADAGSSLDVSGVNLTFSQSAAATLPDTGQITTGTYLPSNFVGDATLEPGGTDNFPAPGPGQNSYGANLGVFNGTTPNGAWSLYVADDEAGDPGSIATGWALSITTSTGGTQWINITSGGSGTGNGTINYTVSPNTGAAQRTGTISVNGTVIHTVTQAGGTDPCGQSTPISAGQTLNGTLANTDCLVLSNYYTDNYSFSGTAGQQVSIAMNSSAVDSYLVLRGPAGTILMEDNNGGGGTNARIPATSGSYMLPSTGTYIFEASTNIGFQTGAYSVSLTSGAPPVNRPVADFDGDGKTDISVFRPSTGGWYLQQSQAGFAGIGFGTNGDVPVPADYDGDGKTDIAVYRPSAGTWYLLRSQLGFTGMAFGISTDIPAPGDFDGDGRADIAVFRPSTGTWYIQRSTQGFFAMNFGANGDVPVVANYDGDAMADIAVYRPSTGFWYMWRSTLGFNAINFGTVGDKPAPGDFDGDSKADLAVFRPSNGTWYVQRSQLGFTSNQWGTNGDKPATGDYDGDGRADYAVFRPSTGGWHLLRSQLGYFGLGFGTNGDIPAPGAYVP